MLLVWISRITISDSMNKNDFITLIYHIKPSSKQMILRDITSHRINTWCHKVYRLNLPPLCPNFHKESLLWISVGSIWHNSSRKRRQKLKLEGMAECLQKYLYASFNLKMQSFGRSIIYVAPLQWSRQSYYTTCFLKRSV